MCEFRSLMLLDFFCHIQSISSVADLIAVGRSVSAGNSSERSYLFTTPNCLIVCAGVPSSHTGRTFWPSDENPLSMISRHMSTNNTSALLITYLRYCISSLFFYNCDRPSDHFLHLLCLVAVEDRTFFVHGKAQGARGVRRGCGRGLARGHIVPRRARKDQRGFRRRRVCAGREP